MYLITLFTLRNNTSNKNLLSTEQRVFSHVQLNGHDSKTTFGEND